MDIRKKAQARVIKWRKELKKGYEIAKMTKLSTSVISNISTGNGNVSDKACQRVLDAKDVVK